MRSVPSFADRQYGRLEILMSKKQSDLASVMLTVAGRSFIWGLIRSCGTFDDAFSPDALQMAHSEGKRSVGAMLVSMAMSDCPEALKTAMSEAIDNDSFGRRNE